MIFDDSGRNDSENFKLLGHPCKIRPGQTEVVRSFLLGQIAEPDRHPRLLTAMEINHIIRPGSLTQYR